MHDVFSLTMVVFYTFGIVFRFLYCKSNLIINFICLNPWFWIKVDCFDEFVVFIVDVVLYLVLVDCDDEVFYFN